MTTFFHHVALAAPLFSLVFVGYALMRLTKWPVVVSDSLTRFVFSVALPATLFRLLSDFSSLPPVDARLLIAFFGGCLIVFGIGRMIAWKVFALDGVSQSVFALGGVDESHVRALREGGVHGVALMRAVPQSPSPAGTLRELLALTR